MKTKSDVQFSIFHRHKNVQIRKLTAQFLVDLVEKMGSGRILSGVKDITDRVLPTAAQFAMDGSQETRYWATLPHTDINPNKYLRRPGTG